jgi:ribosome-binding protein aMBF1 (putative translation factor)
MTRLERERRRLGWNQTVLAYHARTTQCDVSRIERRQLIPTPTYAERLAAALRLNVDELLDEVRADPDGGAASQEIAAKSPLTPEAA